MAKELKLDILLPSVESLGKEFPIKWIGYIPDFQHKYLEKYFTERDIKRRNLNYGKISDDARRILVNSENAKKDIIKFTKCDPQKVQALPFAPSIVESWLEDSRDSEILKKYNITTKFFIISNQFWIHKDHKTAFEAFKEFTGIIESQNKDVLLVCTGKTYDSRFPNYYSELKDFSKQNGLNNKIIILGLIPKLDQISLMRKSLALVQPTLFEGGPGGGSVYDAVALGKKVIVSDIDINREIKDERVTFFKAGDSNDLSKKMFNLYVENDSTSIDRDTLIQQSNKRLDNLGDAIFECLES
jgi:glycosyltransferase involved in cell wall biosynthesis